MLDFITNSRYRNPTSCVQYQDSIINRPGINLLEVDSYIKELNKYNIIFNSILGLNEVPESNIAIRQNILLSTLYYIKKDLLKTKEYKVKADEIFVKLKKNWMYIEGWSYLQYVKHAYTFHYKHVPLYFAGFVDLETFSTMEKVYRKFASPDNKLLFTDTSFQDELLNEERVDFVNDLYSVHFLNNQSTYVFINHNNCINEHSKNLHVNYEFGHFCVFSNGKWLVLHPFYPGYGLKQKSSIKESWNNNIIVDGNRTKEKIWRYLPDKPSLEWSYKDKTYDFKIGKNITRKIEILENGIFVADSGGEYSSFNLSQNVNPNFNGSKTVENLGWHSEEYDKVKSHKRIELYGDHRMFYLEF